LDIFLDFLGFVFGVEFSSPEFFLFFVGFGGNVIPYPSKRDLKIGNSAAKRIV